MSNSLWPHGLYSQNSPGKDLVIIFLILKTFTKSIHYTYAFTDKNWCFWTVVLEKTLESPLDCKEIQPVHSEGDQPWDFFGRNDTKAETPVLWPPHAKSWLIGKDSDAQRDWGQDGHEFVWTPGAGDGQGGLACCNSWGHKDSDTPERLNWTDIDMTRKSNYFYLNENLRVLPLYEHDSELGHLKVPWAFVTHMRVMCFF